jgi:hypothetical protein
VSLFDAPVLINTNHAIENLQSGEPLLDEWLRIRAIINLESGAIRRKFLQAPRLHPTANRVSRAGNRFGQIQSA